MYRVLKFCLRKISLREPALRDSAPKCWTRQRGPDVDEFKDFNLTIVSLRARAIERRDFREIESGRFVRSSRGKSFEIVGNLAKAADERALRSRVKTLKLMDDDALREKKKKKKHNDGARFSISRTETNDRARSTRERLINYLLTLIAGRKWPIEVRGSNYLFTRA